MVPDEIDPLSETLSALARRLTNGKEGPTMSQVAIRQGLGRILGAIKNAVQEAREAWCWAFGHVPPECDLECGGSGLPCGKRCTRCHNPCGQCE